MATQAVDLFSFSQIPDWHYLPHGDWRDHRWSEFVPKMNRLGRLAVIAHLDYDHLVYRDCLEAYGHYAQLLRGVDEGKVDAFMLQALKMAKRTLERLELIERTTPEPWPADVKDYTETLLLRHIRLSDQAETLGKGGLPE